MGAKQLILKRNSYMKMRSDGELTNWNLLFQSTVDDRTYTFKCMDKVADLGIVIDRKNEEFIKIKTHKRQQKLRFTAKNIKIQLCISRHSKRTIY